MKTTAALSDSASALPDDVASDGVHICTKYHSRPPLGSPFRLPVMFQGNLGRGVGDSLVARALFARAAFAIVLYVLLPSYIHNIFHYL